MAFFHREQDVKKLLSQRTRELRSCENRFRNIIDKIDDGLIICDYAGEVLRANVAAEKLMQRKARELIGMRLPFPVVAGKTREFELAGGNGHRVPVEMRVVSVEWGGKPANLAILRDTSKKKKTEEEFRKLYRAVLQSPSIVMITDADATIQFVNPKFTEVTGYTAVEALGQNPHILKSGKMSSDFYRQMWGTITSGEEWRGEIINRRKNGELYWERLSISPVKDIQGRITHFVGVSEDINDQKRQEEAFRKVNRALKTLSEANSAVITATDEGGLLYDICRIIVAYGGYVMAWVGYKGGGEEKIIEPVAEWNVDREFLKAMRITWQENHPRGMGPTGTATRTGTTRIIQNVSEDPTYSPWREQALSQGYGSMVAIALKGEAEPFGVLCIFAHETDAFQPEEVDLLTKLADNLSFGVRTLRNRRERRRIEQELRATFEQAAVGIAHVSPEGRWRRVNRKLCDIVGYSCQELLEMTFQEITHPDDLRADLDLVRDLALGKIATYTLEKRYLRKDRSTVWISLTVSLMRKEDGSPDYFIAIIEDISGRKQAEDQLRQSEQNLRIIFNSVYDAIFIHDLNGNIIDLNDKMLEMYHIDREQGRMLSIRDDYSGPNAPVGRLPEIWQRVLGGEKLLLEWEARRPGDGSLFPVEVFLRRVTFCDQDVILANVRDITERKKAEQAVKQSEEQVRLLLNSTAEGIYALDLSGKCFLCNASSLKILGYSSEIEMIDKNIHMMIHHTRPDGRPYPMEECRVIQRLRHGEQVHADDEYFWTKSGEGIPVEYWSHPLVHDGNIVGAVVTFLDIRERKAAEARLKESERRLAEAQRIAHLGSWEWDLASDKVVWSEELYHMFGVPLTSSPTPELFFGLLVPEDRAWVMEKTQEVVRERKPFSEYFRIRRTDGMVRIIFTQGEVVADAAGNLKVIATNQDVTELKETEEALRESESKFSKAFRLAPVILTISRVADGVYIDVNEAYEKAFGYRRDEAIGRSSFELGIWGNPADRETVVGALRKEGRVRDYQLAFKHRSGRMFLAHLSADLIEVRGEQCLLSMAVDITGQKRKDEELEILHTELANRVAQLEAADAKYKACKKMVTEDYLLCLRQLADQCRIVLEPRESSVKREAIVAICDTVSEMEKMAPKPEKSED